MRYYRDDVSEAAARREAKVLLERVQAGDEGSLPVLADALLLSDARREGERLALALQKQRTPLGARALHIALKRVDEALSYPSEARRREYEDNERDRGRVELRRTEWGWGGAPAGERRDEIARVVNDIETSPEILAERIGWLFDGVFGHGPMLLAREIADLPPRQNREAQLVRLVLALDDSMGAEGVNRVWNALSPAAKANVNLITRGALMAEGAEYPEPKPKPKKRTRKTSADAARGRRSRST